MALPMVYGGPGRYVQGPGELSRQGRYLSWLGCAAYVLFDQGTEDRLCRQIVDGFLDEDLSEPFFKIYNGPCTEEAVVEMAKEPGLSIATWWWVLAAARCSTSQRP